MRRFVRSRLAVVSLGLLVAGALAGALSDAPQAQDSWAQAAVEPVVTARLYVPIDPGTSMTVEPNDDTDTNLRLRTSIIGELEANGRAVTTTGAAPLLLRFATDHVTDTMMQRLKPEDRNRAPGARFPMIRDELGTSMPLQTQGLSPVRAVASGAVRYRLQATLEGRGTGQVLWRGEAIGDVRVNEIDEATLGRQLAAALMAEFGRTVEHQP